MLSTAKESKMNVLHKIGKFKDSKKGRYKNKYRNKNYRKCIEMLPFPFPTPAA